MWVLRLHKLTGLDKDMCADLRQLPSGTGSDSGGRRFIDFCSTDKRSDAKSLRD